MRHCNHCGKFTSQRELCDCRKAAKIKDGKRAQDMVWCFGEWMREMISRERRVAEVACTEGC